MISRSRFLVAAAIVICTLSLGCTKKDAGNGAGNESGKSEVLIGHLGALSGSEATFGVNTKNGIQMAVEEWNTRGGIHGKTIKIKSLDNQGKPEEAAATATRLINQDHVLALIGDNTSSRSLAAAPIAQQNKIPLISPTATTPKLTQIGNYIFRICFIDPFQGQVMAKFATDNLKLKRVAVLRDVKSDFSVGIADIFKKKFAEFGGVIVNDSSYQSGDIDFKAQLTQMKAQKPDAIFIPGYYTEVGLIARQARQLGLDIPLLGTDSWDSAKLSEIGGKAIDGSYFSNHYTVESTDSAVKTFVEKFKSKYGSSPDGVAAMGYDAANILFTAMERTTDLKPEQIRDELAKTKDYPAVTGKITIDAERNAVKSAVVVKVDGKFNRYVTTLTP